MNRLVSTALFFSSLFNIQQVSLANIEPCGINVYAKCHPVGSPEGTMCTGYLPSDWTTNPPDNYEVDITVTYIMANEFTDGTPVILSYLNAVTVGEDSDLGGVKNFNDRLNNTRLGINETYEIATIETLDLNKTTVYKSLVTAVVLYWDTTTNQQIEDVCHGHVNFTLVTGTPSRRSRRHLERKALGIDHLPEILEFEEGDEGHNYGEPCEIGIYAWCHPVGSPEGTLCTDYIPPEWINVQPQTPEDYLQDITVNYIIVNESPTLVDIDLSALFATLTAPGTNLGGSRNFEDKIMGVSLGPNENITISTTETLDLSERRQYGALVTVVSTMDNGGICHGHDAFRLIAGINSCNQPCEGSADCTACPGHDCSPFTRTCRDLGAALIARAKVGCRNDMGGQRRCSDDARAAAGRVNNGGRNRRFV